MDAPDEVQVNSVTQQVTQQKSEKSKPTCHHCKKPSHYRNQYCQLKRGKDQGQYNTNSAGNNNDKNSSQTKSDCNNKIPNNTNANNTNNQKERNPDLSTHPLRPMLKLTIPEKYYFRVNAANKPEQMSGRTESGSTEIYPIQF